MLRGDLRSADASDVLVFVHGYNVTFADAARRAAQLKCDLKFTGTAALFSWPSVASPWPWKYTVNEANVAWAVPDLREFLRLLRVEVGARTVSVIAHSMGNRALVNLLSFAASSPEPAGAAQLGQIVLAAPTLTRIPSGASPADSPASRGGSRSTPPTGTGPSALEVRARLPRAGDAGQNLVIVNGIDTIDASALDTNLVGHSYYGDNRSLLTDLYTLVREGKPPDDRFGLRPRSLAAHGTGCSSVEGRDGALRASLSRPST